MTAATPTAVDGKLSFDAISRRFPDGTVALEDVSFTVTAGEFVSILGPSGCGKSTLLKMIAGLTPATVGEVLLEGKRVVAPPPGLIYVFQQYSKSLLPWKTVLGNLMFGARSPRARGSSCTPPEP